MAERTKYAPGEFCWFELATNDAARAKSFYSELFGWSCEDVPAGPGMTYTMCRVRGKDVGALYAMTKEQAGRGEPPHWTVYVSVESADAAAAQAAKLGGKIFAPAFDVLQVGRMAVIADPEGAPLALWQAKSHIGAGLIEEPGAFCWLELSTGDAPAAGKFYEQLFGWKLDGGSGPDPYLHITAGGHQQDGIRTMQQEEKSRGVPPHWMGYVAVERCSDAVAAAERLGATPLVRMMTIESGAFGVLRDPTGAVFAVYEHRG
jgi:predicted enzyme related to lactoylglutathione lyase